MDLVGFGNLIAFIPFGIFIPLLYRISFIRFITMFFLAIMVMETMQALSFLGSFDINDALLNSLGVAIGFGAYNNINSFRISGQDINPRFNIYGVEGRNMETFTYKYKEQMTLSLYYGTPEPSDYSGSVRVSVDGQEVLNSSGEVQRLYPVLFPAMFKIPIQAGGELTITIEGNEKVWDVGYRKMQYPWN